MKWVSIESHCKTTGESRQDVEDRISNGEWDEGVHYKLDGLGSPMISIKGFNSWIELGFQKPEIPELANVDGKNALYRCFDSNGKLVYVGISMNLPSCIIDHVNSSRWMVMVSRVDIEWHDSRKAAEHAERAAIKKEMPYFNVVHNKR